MPPAPQQKAQDNEATIALLKEKAKVADQFRIKLKRRITQGAYPELIATLENATLEQIANPERWLERLTGGGAFYDFEVVHPSTDVSAIGVLRFHLTGGRPLDTVDQSAFTESDWDGPSESTYIAKSRAERERERAREEEAIGSSLGGGGGIRSSAMTGRFGTSDVSALAASPFHPRNGEYARDSYREDPRMARLEAELRERDRRDAERAEREREREHRSEVLRVKGEFDARLAQLAKDAADREAARERERERDRADFAERERQRDEERRREREEEKAERQREREQERERQDRRDQEFSRLMREREGSAARPGLAEAIPAVVTAITPILVGFNKSSHEMRLAMLKQQMDAAISQTQMLQAMLNRPPDPMMKESIEAMKTAYAQVAKSKEGPTSEMAKTMADSMGSFLDMAGKLVEMASGLGGGEEVPPGVQIAREITKGFMSIAEGWKLSARKAAAQPPQPYPQPQPPPLPQQAGPSQPAAPAPQSPPPPRKTVVDEIEQLIRQMRPPEMIADKFLAALRIHDADLNAELARHEDDPVALFQARLNDWLTPENAGYVERLLAEIQKRGVASGVIEDDSAPEKREPEPEPEEEREVEPPAERA